MPRLTDTQIVDALAGLPGWSLSDAGIRKQFDPPTYADAIAALARVGFEAEAAQHHPDVAMSWKRITFTLTTHDEGGVTEKDIAMARAIEAIMRGR